MSNLRKFLRAIFPRRTTSLTPVPDGGAILPPAPPSPSLLPIPGFMIYGQEATSPGHWTVARDDWNVHWYRTWITPEPSGVRIWHHWEDSDDEVPWVTNGLQVDGIAYQVVGGPARRFLTLREISDLVRIARERRRAVALAAAPAAARRSLEAPVNALVWALIFLAVL